MANNTADRNLLFGILALQMDFITRDQLITAMNTWVIDKSKSVEQILLDQKSLAIETHELLSALVMKHLELHGDDVEKSLGAISSIGLVKDALLSLTDPEVNATIPLVGANLTSGDVNPDAETLPPVKPTSADIDIASEGDERFCVLRNHAKGGLGEVFVARDRELNREVALKEIQRPYAHDENSRQRFVMEAEITGGLEHPGIVPVYGLGKYGDGRPFYAMRFIRGDSLGKAIKQFHREEGAKRDADQRKLGLRHLLGRFIDVCNAIEYAHSRGVLHRDLKPGNIMLGKYGETLVVDWGLAKSIGRAKDQLEVGEVTLRPRSGSGSTPTQMGSAIGTPAYMSPEQASGKLDELGPATDVYSLGATLYCLLTGRPPVTEKKLAPLLKKVQSGDFPHPRQIDANIPKPLDAICLRALALDAKARYGSAREIADDVERYLADEPIDVYSEPLIVRAQRWRRKHPKLVASLAASVLLGIISLATLSSVVSYKNQELADANYDLINANTRERQAKNNAQKSAIALAELNEELVTATESEHEAKLEAESKREEAEAITNYLIDAFKSPDPSRDGRTITLVELLGPSVESLDEKFVGSPVVKAVFLYTIGGTYRGLGLIKESVEVLERSLKLFQEHNGPTHLDTIHTMNRLAMAYQALGDLQRAVPLLEQALEICQEKYGSENITTLQLQSNLASAFKSQGKFDESVRINKIILDIGRDTLGPENPETLSFMNNLASSLEARGDQDRALAMYEEVLEIHNKNHGPEHPTTLAYMNNIALVYQRQGNFEKSLPMQESILQLSRETLGLTHHDTVNYMNNLATAYRDQGLLEDAASLLQDSLQICREKQLMKRSQSLQVMGNLALVLESQGDLAQALPLFEELLVLRSKTLGPTHIDTLIAMNNLASAYENNREFEKAQATHEETLRLRRASLGNDHRHTIFSMNNLGMLYRSQGELEKAQKLLEETVNTCREEFGLVDHDTLSFTYNLSLVYQSQMEFDKAQKLLEETVKRCRETPRIEYSKYANFITSLGDFAWENGEFEKAFPLYEETLQFSRQSLGVDHRDTLVLANNLAARYFRQGNFNKAKQMQEETVEMSRERYGFEFPKTLAFMTSLAIISKAAGDLDQSAKLLRELLEYRRQTLGPGHRDTLSNLDNLANVYQENGDLQQLVELYEAWGKTEEAIQWREKLEKNDQDK